MNMEVKQKYTRQEIAEICAKANIDKNSFMDRLKKEVVHFKFFKVNGTIREAWGTRIPEVIVPELRGGTANTGSYPFWDTEENGWRSVYLSRIFEVL